MTTGTHDELSAPHFEDALWAELEAHHRRQLSATEPDVVPLDRRAGRRSWHVAAGAVAATATLVVGIAVLSNIASDPAAASTAERISAALDAAATDSVVHTVDTSGATDGTVHEAWYDEATGAVRSVQRDRDGHVQYDNGQRTVPTPDGDAATEHQRMVVHCHSAYAEVDAPDAADWLGEPQAQALREALATGDWVDEGDEVVDGQQLGRLRLTGYDHEETLLFDRTTYRPVRRVTGAGADAVVTDYEYLPRTPEDLDVLVTPAPDGYTRMTQVELDRLGPC